MGLYYIHKNYSLIRFGTYLSCRTCRAWKRQHQPHTSLILPSAVATLQQPEPSQRHHKTLHTPHSLFCVLRHSLNLNFFTLIQVICYPPIGHFTFQIPSFHSQILWNYYQPQRPRSEVFSPLRHFDRYHLAQANNQPSFLIFSHFTFYTFCLDLTFLWFS